MVKSSPKKSKRSGERSKTQSDRTKGSKAAESQANSSAPASIGETDADRSTTPIIGIGASAGGVEALSRFFDNMPPDSGSAFVVILHLDPTRESKMAELLSHHTRMTVVQVEDAMRVEPDHVYVIAPDKYLKVRDRTLHLSEPPEARGHRHPVDVFFKSLAEDQRERAVAIVLSGTGTNGTDGLKDVRAEGGIILVQTPATAKFDGMPRSAISADLADHVLAPKEMPETLLRFLRHGYVASPDRVEPRSNDGASLDKVLETVHARSGNDFRSYKRSTLGRRVHRRLGIRDIGTLEKYVEELRANPEEVAALVHDLLISVTRFFRDPDAWKALADLAIAPLVAERETGATLRIWVPGCSTGEEAYSIAMLVTTQAEAAGKRFDVKVFATDAQEETLRKAREGVYPDAAVASIPVELRRRFFDKLDGSQRVKKELRDMVVFSPQNLLRDPPFSRMDLISCRNLLIYLDAEAQQRVIALCHFALREGACLFLGNAETVGGHADLFETASKKWRIYRRLGPTRHDIVSFPVAGGRREPDQDNEPPPQRPAPPAAEIARRALLEHYAPASVLIDGKGRALYFHGTTGDYLEQPPGEPTKDLLAMARDGLGATLRTAIRKASSEAKPVTVNARIRQGETSRPLRVSVTPVASSGQSADAMLVVFEPEPSAPASAKRTRRDDAGTASSRERSLDEELKEARAELRNTTEQMENANEELKASNEEVTSMNEELQSTNEELETSKEEMQSFNEELSTVNNQLQHKVKELEDLTSDLNNLLAGTGVATIFLDASLCIKWFSPATEELFDLAQTDIGRPVEHFARKFADEDLLPDVQKVLDKLTMIEAEVRSSADKWYLRRVLPYRTLDNRIAGAVVSFTDITDRKRSVDAINEAGVYAQTVVETIREPLLVLDGDLRVQSANRAFCEKFRVSKQDTEGALVYELGNGQWNIPRLRTLLDEVLSKDETFNDFELEHDFRDIGARCMLLNARKLTRGNGREELILLAIEDITERQRAQVVAERLAAIVKFSDDAIIGKDLDGIINNWNQGAERLFGYTFDEIVGKSITTLIPSERQEEETEILGRIRGGEHISHFETVRLRKDGSPVWVSLTISPIKDVEGKIIGASKIARDITERRRADEHRKILTGELSHRVKNVMATVQAVAAQTLSSASSMEEAREAFEARLIALANAHDMLTRENWRGADLISIAEESVYPYTGGQSRFTIEGPRVWLKSNAALSFAMALHELCTNASKYGALSKEGGHVEILWRVEGDGDKRRLHFRWAEQGGPPVAAPTRKGFGSRLIERALPMELGGEVRVVYEPSGVVCTIDAPLSVEEEQGEYAWQSTEQLNTFSS